MADHDLLEPPLTPITLTGTDVVLRPWHHDDASCVIDAATDPRIVEITSVPTAPDEQAACAFVDRQHDRLRTGAGWALAIEHRGTAVGHIGLWLDAKRHGRAEIGYWVAPLGRGAGAAASAVRLVTDWAFATLPLHRIDLFIEPWNTASQRTAEKAGYQRGPFLERWQVIDGTPRDMWAYTRVGDD